MPSAIVQENDKPHIRTAFDDAVHACDVAAMLCEAHVPPHRIHVLAVVSAVAATGLMRDEQTGACLDFRGDLEALTRLLDTSIVDTGIVVAGDILLASEVAASRIFAAHGALQSPQSVEWIDVVDEVLSDFERSVWLIVDSGPWAGRARAILERHHHVMAA